MLTATATLLPSLRELVRDLGPFWNLDRHAARSVRPARDGAPAVFYADLEPGARVELTITEVVPRLSANALLMARADGGWDVFDDDGLIAAYEADVVHVALRQ